MGRCHTARIRFGAARWVPVVVAVSLLTALVVGSAIQPGLAVNNPSITVTSSPSTEVGLQIFAVSNLSNGANPSGTITFQLYGPGDTTCSTPIATFTVAVNGNGPYTSPSFITTQAGTYRWQARYSGDVNNTAAGPTVCTDPAAAVVVAKARTVLTTTASGPVGAGGQIFDTAVLAGGLNPTGTITFFVYGPTDQFCSTPLATSTATVNGNGTYQSAPFTANTPGVYKWRASYDGDANNLGVSITACLDPNEASTVTPAGPTLVTTASPATVVGGQVSDTAVLAGATNPTGTITFSLYGPDDATCAGPVRSTSTRTVNGNGTYTSDPFTPTAPGTYRWVARYSGDANNPALANACGDPAETVVVTAAPTTTTTTSTSTPTSTSTSTTTTTLVPTSTTSTSSTVAPTTSSSTTTTTIAPTTTSSTTTTLAPTSTTSSTSSTTTTVAPTSTTSSTSTSTTSTTVAPTSTSSTSTSTTSTTTLAATTTSTTVAVAVATGTTVAPATPTVSVSPNPVAAGQNATVTGSGFPAGPAAITLFSTPVLLRQFTVGAAGTFAVVVTIPADTPPGAHRLVVTGAAGAVLAETQVTVTAPGLLQAVVAAVVPTVRLLSRTGSDVTGPGTVALGLLFVGGVAVGLTRRRPLTGAAAERQPYRRRRRQPWD